MIGAAPLLPAMMLFQVSSTLLPTGVIAPRPVTTTLFNSIFKNLLFSYVFILSGRIFPKAFYYEIIGSYTTNNKSAAQLPMSFFLRDAYFAFSM